MAPLNTHFVISLSARCIVVSIRAHCSWMALQFALEALPFGRPVLVQILCYLMLILSLAYCSERSVLQLRKVWLSETLPNFPLLTWTLILLAMSRLIISLVLKCFHINKWTCNPVPHWSLWQNSLIRLRPETSNEVINRSNQWSIS